MDNTWFKNPTVTKVCVMLAVCFEVYDFNGDGYISREEMFTCLKKSMVKQTTEEDPDEGIKDLVELSLKKMVYNFNSCVCYVAVSAQLYTSVSPDWQLAASCSQPVH